MQNFDGDAYTARKDGKSRWRNAGGLGVAHGLLIAGMLAVVGMVAYLVNRVSVLNQRLVGWKDGIAAGSIMPWSVVSLYNNTTGQTVHVTTSTAAPILVLAPGIDHTPGSAVRLVPVDQDGTAGRALRSGDFVYIQFVAWGLFYSATDPSRLTNDRASAAKVQINFAKADESGDLQPTAPVGLSSGSTDGAWKDLSQSSADVRLLPSVAGTAPPSTPGHLLGQH